MSISSRDKSKEKSPLKKVGIPRALYYHKFFPFWVELLQRMGCEIILSPETDPAIVGMGSEFCTSEFCPPMRIFYGHVQYLLKNYPDLDYLFIPRYASLDKNHYSCPHFMALPDSVKHVIKPQVPILEWEINTKKMTNIESAIELGKIFGIEKNKAGELFVLALNDFRKFGSFMRKKKILFPKAVYRNYKKILKSSKPKKIKSSGDGNSEVEKLNILVLGHPYNLYEPLLNNNLIEWLQEHEINIISINSVPKDVFKERVTLSMKFKNYYGSEEELLQAARHYLIDAQDEVDGVIFVTSTACVCDSLIGDLLKRNFIKIQKPFLTVVLDGHFKNIKQTDKSGESQIISSVEVFVNKIRGQKV